jgi:hypothetical protein
LVSTIRQFTAKPKRRSYDLVCLNQKLKTITSADRQKLKQHIMKTLFKISSAFMLFFLIGTSNAATPLVSLSTGDDPKTLVLNFDSKSTKSTLQLTNQDNEEILTETLSEGIFNRKINLQNLHAGTYYFTAENDKVSVVYTIELDNTSAQVIDRSENQKSIVFREVGDLVQMNLLNLESEKVHLEIVNQDGEQVFEETIKDTIIIGKQFNFENAIKGAYTVSVTDGQTYHYHTIEVR